jgi:PAS domain S-box-containing protein
LTGSTLRGSWSVHSLSALFGARGRAKAKTGHNVGREAGSRVDAAHLVHELEVHQVELKQQNEELRRTHAELQESRDRFWDLYDHAPVGYLTLDREGRITQANLAAAELLRRPRSELVGLALSSFLGPADADRLWLQRHAAVVSEAKQTCDVHLNRWDGSVAQVRLDMAPDRDPKSSRVNVVMVDFTDLRQAQDELRKSDARLLQAQKIEALGTLAGGLAHNLRNILQAIMASIGYAQMGGAQAPTSARALERALSATNRGVALIDRLMTFARKQDAEMKLQPVRLDDQIREAAGLLRVLLGTQIQLEVQPAAPEAVVLADPVQLEQVLLNLAANARDAMPGGGTLSIATREALLDEPTARAHGLAPGTHAVVTVRDSGAGMDEGTRAHLFEPFFTTKDVGKGTGLGLSTTYALVRQFGGRIEVESRPGAGTTFQIWLPAAP